ncbi:MAG TPA: response regulator [Candidatus Sulfotelmatobacter sp.]|nr:response regulator [Candidatus Sulfotelmatobacter sp.]
MARKILLADDSVTAQNMGRKILADAGYEVITVNNGSAALKKISEQKPDLIVLDVYMPGYSGLEVCQRLKEVGETSRIPVLLTVGKLEPFKPEEAKRVRADAFIVKPFEASELLSALSKLEDKVVPRADSSKPGRFARATAAIEEGRYDKTMTAAEDDTGWKRRIAFPSKKKQGKPAEEAEDNADDPAIYNPVNKDLRTVITHKDAQPAPAAETAHAEEAPVNLGALAPEGLPKDVTPEEIAALAAAAAQIKGKALEEKPPTPLAEIPVNAPTETEAPKTEFVEAAKLETTANAENKEAQEEVRPVESVPLPEVAAAAPPVTFAEQQPAEKIEANSTDPGIVSQADAMTAMMGLETQMMAVHFPIPGNGTGTNSAASPTLEPATMAVAALADSAAAPSRWSAVAVAVASDEAAISLEQEMQKAYAAFAAAEGGHIVAASTTPEAKPAVAEPLEAPAVTAECPVAEAAAAIPATVAPEVAQPLAAVSVAATEAISAAVKELEAVAAKYEAERITAPPEPIADKSLQAAALESPAAAPDAEPKPEQRTEEKIEEKIEPTVQEKIDTKVEEQPKEAELPQQAGTSEVTAEAAAPQDQPQSEKTQDEHAAPVAETPEPVAEAERHEQESKSEEVSTEPVPVSRSFRAGGSDEMAKRESETAAAWASWRKIRETGSSKASNPTEASVQEVEAAVPEDRAAMAVAAGAESKPEEVAGSFDSDPEIASIVDSVLADMRPKIVEEIARKLGKKK